jgi:hypothetical protein
MAMNYSTKKHCITDEHNDTRREKYKKTMNYRHKKKKQKTPARKDKINPLKCNENQKQLGEKHEKT